MRALHSIGLSVEVKLDRDELHQLLQSVHRGDVSVADAEHRLRGIGSYQTVGPYATVDHHRRRRCGFPEVIFGQGKSPEQIEGILRALEPNGEGCLVTRIAPEAAERAQRAFPVGEYNEVARTFRIAPPGPPSPRSGVVRIVTAGTSDLPVAEEARVTADAWNCDVRLIADVGVAGIHRLFGRLDELRGADAIVAVAGMEAALPSVLGGLVDCPVIGVPTSIGYGASFGGVAALLGMLNCCASSVVVVNIDAGFNGGHVASLIARRAAQAREGLAPTSVPSERK